MAKAGPIIIIKKAKGHAAHGGAWKVAYADFVTAMMALFIVLWLMSQTNETMRKEIAQYFRTGIFSGAPSLLGSGMGLLNGADLDVRGNSLGQEEKFFQEGARQLKELLKDREMSGLQDHVAVEVTREGLLIQIVDGSDDLLFDLSSSELKPSMERLLKRLGPVLGKIPNTLQIHGHTDGRPFPRGSSRDNWVLSFERAHRARSLLDQAGVRPGQIVGVFAHGSSAPLDTDPLSAKNRRISILAVRRGVEEVVARGMDPARTSAVDPGARTNHEPPPSIATN